MSHFDDSVFSDDEIENGLEFVGPFENRHKATDTGGLNCKINVYETHKDPSGTQRTLLVGRTQGFETEDRDHDAALVEKKIFDEDGKLKRTEVRVQSPFIRTALREVIGKYPGLNLNATCIVMWDLPRCFFHYREALSEYAKNLQDGEAIRHLNFGMRYMYRALADALVVWSIWVETTLLTPGLEHKYLWMAFRPGSLLWYHRGRSSNTLQPRIVRCEDFDTTCITVTCAACDEQQIGRRELEVAVPHYDQFKPFTDLSVYPLEYHPDQQKLYTDAVARGKRALVLMGKHFLYFHGTAVLLSQASNSRSVKVNSRVMIDAEAFKSAHPRTAIELDADYSIYLSKMEAMNHLTDDDFATWTPVVPGFSLQDKQWGLFPIDQLSNIDFNADAFDALILPEKQKAVLKSLVQSHAEARCDFDDIIKGKGKGLVILLHGATGAGKTMTAESIAEHTRQPLYVISSGDLGTDVQSVEKRLEKILRVGARWNAIVLLDEADVFLEQRSTANIDRNAIVSVFLRVLEYYDGIIILTTNRVQDFDEAFASRVHVSFYYAGLDFDARRKLWGTFLVRALPNDTSLPEWLNDTYLNEVAAHNLNGRQIKNAVRTGHTLAVMERTSLDPRHLKVSIENIAAHNVLINAQKSAGDLDMSEEPIRSGDHRASDSLSAHERPRKRHRS